MGYMDGLSLRATAKRVCPQITEASTECLNIGFHWSVLMWYGNTIYSTRESDRLHMRIRTIVREKPIYCTRESDILYVRNRSSVRENKVVFENL